MRRGLFRAGRVAVATCVVCAACAFIADAQRKPTRAKAQPGKICFDPDAPCPTNMPFEPNDLKFRLPKNAVIFDSEEFYAVVLKVMRVGETDCDKFVPESERKAAQKLFAHRKVFTSRCADTLGVYYSNVPNGERVLALYGGATRDEAERTLAEAKATGKFPDARLRRMHASINGT